MAALAALASCSGDDNVIEDAEDGAAEVPTAAASPSAGSTATTATDPGETAGPATAPPTDVDGGAAVAVEDIGYEVVATLPHDTTAFTQGLLLDDDGRLFEATGYESQLDASVTEVRELDPSSGEVLRSVGLGRDYFGEGLALVDDRLIQLTWTEQLAFVYDVETFDQVGAFAYDGEGWGLCHDVSGERLVMSNGSAELTFRDPENFAPLGTVTVTLDGAPVERLNELECAEGTVLANVWQTDEIVRIDPATGAVTGVLDLADIITPDPAEANSNAVLNGIAYDAEADTYLVTGKLWPTIYEIRLTD